MNDVFARKSDIEEEWIQTGSRKKLGEYINILAEISRFQLGMIPVRAPGCKFPFYLRAGTSDVRNYWQIFQREEYGFDVPKSPKTILDLGAYVGFAAVYLANRFPEATMACIEPSPGNFFALQANTAPYRNIKIFNAAIWDKNTTLTSSGHMAGDWGAMFGENDDGESIEGVSIDEIMKRMGWSTIDFLKCDCEGAEVQIFADRNVAWRDTIKFSTVETHDRMVENSSSTVRAFFADTFEEEKSGEFGLFKRHGAYDVEEAPTPRETPVFDTSSAATGIELQDVSSEHWGLFFFDRHSFQLHPNNPGQAAAKLNTSVSYTGAGTLKFGVGVMNERAFDVFYSVSATLQDGTKKEVFSKVCSAKDVTEHEVDLPLNPDGTPVQLTFSTQMVGDGLSRMAWARWFDPKVCAQA